MLKFSSLHSAIKTRAVRALSSKPETALENNFGLKLFSRPVQEKYVSGDVLDNIEASTAAGIPVSPTDADAYARGLMNWSLERGAR